jgi:hypothetical protein
MLHYTVTVRSDAYNGEIDCENIRDVGQLILRIIPQEYSKRCLRYLKA